MRSRVARVAVSVSLESAWNDLATREAGESFKSDGRFLAAPADGVKFFAEFYPDAMKLTINVKKAP